MSRKLLLAALALIATSLPYAAAAKPCGDNVGGNDVPCDCGDIVTNNTALGPNDPVTQRQCEADGLIIRSDSTKGLSLDLKGTTLKGSRLGSGILIIYGGTGGARIFSSGSKATISGFAQGVKAHGRNALKLLSDVNITEPTGDGVRITSGKRYRISNVYVRGAGRNGFWLSGERFMLRKTKALNSRKLGYFVMGERSTLGTPGSGVTAQGSGDAGFSIMGSGHRLIDCVAEASGKNGISFIASRSLVHGCQAVGNAKDGIAGTGGNLRFARNRADENEGSGIEVHGHHLQDLGGNRGDLNRLGGLTPPAMQCAIGGQPCN